MANSCEASYVILSHTIDYDADGVIDKKRTHNYNEEGKLISIVDDNTSENISTFTYNDRGLLEQEIYYEYIGFDLVSDFTYDANGNKITEYRTYIEDDYNLTSITLISNEFSYPDEFITFEYDDNNLLASSTMSIDDNGTTRTTTSTYDYDQYGNILILDYNYYLNGYENNIVISYTYTYSSDNKILEEKVDYDNDGTLDRLNTYYYDNNGYKIEDHSEYKNYNGEISKSISTYEWGCI